MTVDELFTLIESGRIFLSRAQTKALFGLKQADYDIIVLNLLQNDFVELSNRRHDGCILFAVRPNPSLYPNLLSASLDIGDPSSIRDGVVALLQVKSADNVAEDLLAQIEPSSDTRTARVFWMFYWTGFGPKSLTTNNAWPGYDVSVYLHYLRKDLKFRSRRVVSTQTTPMADSKHAEQVSLSIIQKMLDLFEQNNANQTARSIIALLAPSQHYPSVVQARIRDMYKLAKQSSDEYVRHRVQQYKV